MLKLIIIADTNDADYIHRMVDITEEELVLVQKVTEAILATDEDGVYNWPIDRDIEEIYNLYKGMLTKKEIDDFNMYVPYGEYGIHTIQSIEVFDVVATASMYKKE